MINDEDEGFFTTINTQAAIANVINDQTFYGENFGNIQPSFVPQVEELPVSYANSDSAVVALDQAFQAQNSMDNQLEANNADLASINHQNNQEAYNGQIQEFYGTVAEISNQTAANLNGTSLSTDDVFINQYTY